MHEHRAHRGRLARERRAILEEIGRWLNGPMLLLSLAWLALVVLELIGASSPMLRTTGMVIWALFVIDFALRLAVAPDRKVYLREHWLTALALLAPALRLLPVVPSLFHLVSAARLAGGIQLVTLLGSLNRGMRALRASLERRAIHYMIAFTVIVALVGAAGMYAFERAAPAGPRTYGAALWWTLNLIGSFSAEHLPKTSEGRALSFILGLYGLAVSGYLTAALAAYFLGRDADSKDGEVAGARAIAGLREEIAALHADVRALARRSGRDPGGGRPAPRRAGRLPGRA